jgi:glycosyltransferase involved in cell wall biosynthesis
LKLKIAIIGTRGIPNQYGGYEQAAAFLSAGLVQKGYAVTVYSSHNHPNRNKLWNGVEIVHCYDPEYIAGTGGQFIYDLNCIRHARKKNYDIILMMGYTSSSIWGRFYPKKPVIITNMDGLEWQRSKYSVPVRKYLQYAEKLAVKYSDFYIADSILIQSYLEKKYSISSRFIPYGADLCINGSAEAMNEYNVTAHNYYMLVARMEPENNIETILEGFAESKSDKKFIAVGNTNNSFGRKMLKRFSKLGNILFPGSLFDQEKLHNLRSYCSLYFHGHSVGGTNPSLLEAMVGRVPIAAHNNPFNKAVLGGDAYYFSSPADVRNIIDTFSANELNKQMIRHNMEKIEQQYNWKTIIDQYEEFILHCYSQAHS